MPIYNDVVLFVGVKRMTKPLFANERFANKIYFILQLSVMFKTIFIF
jgi:hypothetical protein